MISSLWPKNYWTLLTFAAQTPPSPPSWHPRTPRVSLCNIRTHKLVLGIVKVRVMPLWRSLKRRWRFSPLINSKLLQRAPDQTCGGRTRDDQGWQSVTVAFCSTQQSADTHSLWPHPLSWRRDWGWQTGGWSSGWWDSCSHMDTDRWRFSAIQTRSCQEHTWWQTKVDYNSPHGQVFLFHLQFVDQYVCVVFAVDFNQPEAKHLKRHRSNRLLRVFGLHFGAYPRPCHPSELTCSKVCVALFMISG